MDALGVNEYYETKAKIEQMQKESSATLQNLNEQITSSNSIVANLHAEIASLQEKDSKLEKNRFPLSNANFQDVRNYTKSVDHAINNFFDLDIPYYNCKIPDKDFDDLDLIAPSVTLKLHCMDVKSLRKSYRENEKQITDLFKPILCQIYH